jgi:hypothetical protein
MKMGKHGGTGNKFSSVKIKAKDRELSTKRGFE